MSCMADSWAGVNNGSSAAGGTTGAFRTSSTEDPASENSSTSSSEASCSTVDEFGFTGSATRRFLPGRVR